MNTTSIISDNIILEGSTAELLTELTSKTVGSHKTGGHLGDFNDYQYDAGVNNKEFVELYQELKMHVVKINAGRKPNRKAILRLLQYGYLLAHIQIYSKEEEEEVAV